MPYCGRTCFSIAQRGKSKAGHQSGRGRSKGGSSNGRGGKPADSSNFYDADEGTHIGPDYVVEHQVGKGTFSVVYSCKNMYDGESYALKIMQPTQKYIQYTSDAKKEGELLKMLTEEDSDGKAWCLTLKEYFPFTDEEGTEWYALVLERLGGSLHDFIKANGYQGLDISVVQALSRCMLSTCAFLHARGYTHTDIKHKNVQLVSTDHVALSTSFPKQTQSQPPKRPYLHLLKPRAKIIDYGNAIHREQHHPKPIHTKQFRAPEVLLESSMWDEKSDLWTLGCTLYYVYTGELMFNTHNTHLHLALLDAVVGPVPDHMLLKSKMKAAAGVAPVQRWTTGNKLDSAELKQLERAKPLKELIHPDHASFVDFLGKLLTLDPVARPPAEELLCHPFITTTVQPDVTVPGNAETRQLA